MKVSKKEKKYYIFALTLTLGYFIWKPYTSYENLLQVFYWGSSIFNWIDMLSNPSVQHLLQSTQPFQMDYAKSTVDYRSVSPSCTRDGARNLPFFFAS